MGKTYTYGKYDKNDMQMYISKYTPDKQIEKDLKFGYLKTKIVHHYYTLKQNEELKIKENIVKLKLEKKIKEELQLEKKNAQIKKQILKENVLEKKEKKKEIEYKNKLFQSFGLLIENYKIDKINTSTGINYLDDIYYPGIEYKIGLLNKSSRYYGTLRITSGFELLASADYITNSKIFFGASIGYGRFKINNTSSTLSGTLYGGQIGYVLNNKIELSYQMLKTNMDEKVSNISYEIDTLNYLLLNYKF